MLLEDTSDTRTASRIIDTIGEFGITVVVERYGLNAEGGRLLTSFEHASGQIWRISADRTLDAAVELAARNQDTSPLWLPDRA